MWVECLDRFTTWTDKKQTPCKLFCCWSCPQFHLLHCILPRVFWNYCAKSTDFDLDFNWLLLCSHLVGTIVPAAYLFILIFSIGYLYLIGEALYLDFKNHAIKLPSITKEDVWDTFKSYLRAFIVLYAWNGVLAIAFPSFVENNILLISLISYFVITVLRENTIYQSKILLYGCGLFDVIMLILTRNSITLSSIIRMVQTYMLVLFVMWTTWIAGKYVYESVPTEEVKAGMILSRSTIVCFAPSRVKGLPQISYEDMRSRLTEDEAAAVRRWKDSKYGKATVITVRKIPFASFIAVGVILFAAYQIVKM